MASLRFLVGQPSSGVVSTLTPGRELAAASLISRGQALSLPHERCGAAAPLRGTAPGGSPAQPGRARAPLCRPGGSGEE